MKILNVLAFTLCLIVTATCTIYWPCDTHDDCTAKYSSCSSATSQCKCTDFDFVFSSDFSTCLKTSLIGDPCEENIQCNLMPTGAKCKSGVCDCADGETYVRGRCRTLNGLNQYCDTDLDCYFGYDRNSVQCKENICTCANGYYHRHGNICRRKSMEIDDVCVVDTDCDQLGENVKCKTLKCQYVNEIKSKVNNNNNNTNQTNTYNNNNISRINNNNNNINNNIKNTRTKRQTSTPTETNSNLSKSSPSESDFNVTTKLVNGLSSTSSTNNNNINSNFSDTDDEDLNTESKQEFISSVAATNTEAQHKSREIAVQTSIDGFELKVLTPKVKHVGTITTTASTSSSSRRPSKQQQRQRRRPTVFRFNDDEKTVSTVSNTDDDVENQEYGFQCTYHGLPCNGLPHSICSNNVCLCRQGYYPKNGKCFAELGEIAESSDECENRYDAETKKCICQNNYYYDHNLRRCRKPIQYHLSCSADNQCSPFGAAFCPPEVPRRCTCKEYAEYDELLQMCAYKTGVGSECETDDGCPVEHTMCSNRKCVCKPNYIEKGDECLPGLNAECLENDDCMVDNSLCATTASNGTQDQSKTCQCRKGFVHFKDECLKGAEEIEEECIDTEQCKPLLASCVDNKCSCSDKQHFQNGHCETRKALNEVCSTASECYVEKGAEKVECRNSVCQCKFGYKSDSGHRTCVASNKKNSSGRPSALKIITFMLIGSAFLITSAAIKQAYY